MAWYLLVTARTTWLPTFPAGGIDAGPLVVTQVEHVDTGEFIGQGFPHPIRRVRIHPATIGHIGQNTAIAQPITAPADGTDIVVIEGVLVGGGGTGGLGFTNPAIQMGIVDVLGNSIGRVADDDLDIQFPLPFPTLRVMRDDLGNKAALSIHLEGVSQSDALKQHIVTAVESMATR